MRAAGQQVVRLGCLLALLAAPWASAAGGRGPGNAARLLMLLNYLNGADTDQGQTDGLATDLVFTHGDDLYLTSVRGIFAGRSLQVDVSREGRSVDGLPRLRYRSSGGEVPLDLTEASTPGPEFDAVKWPYAEGWQESGTVDGHRVTVSFRYRDSVFDGRVGDQRFHLSVHTLQSASHLGGFLGADDIDLTGGSTYTSGDYPVQSAFTVRGKLGPVEIDEHETTRGDTVMF